MTDRLTKKSIVMRWDWFILFLVLAFVCFVRIRLLATPLERDEGEFAYMGQLLLQGIPPYKLACNMKFPGIYAAYALIMAVFGQSTVGIHIGLLVVNAAAIVLVFLLARKLFGHTAGAVACAVYAFLTISRHSLGTSAHATHFVALFALAGIIALLKGMESSRKAMLFLSGFLLGVGVLMKQPGLFFVVFALLYLLYNDISTRKFSRRNTSVKLFTVAFGAFVPIGITGVLLAVAGVFSKFWFWTFVYGMEYATMLPISETPRILLFMAPICIGSNAPIWLATLASLLAVTFAGAHRKHRFFLWSLGVCSILAVSVGLYFREHYFIFAAPAAALLVGAGTQTLSESFSGEGIRRWLRFGLPLTVTIGILGYPLYCQSDFLFRATPEQASRIMYGKSPFVESVTVGEYLRKHTKPTDTIVVVGSEPQIYFYSGRHSATSHIYMYGMMEDQPYAKVMQNEMIEHVAAARPKFIVYVSTPGSWLINPNSDLSVLTWAGNYCRKYYERVGIAEILDKDWTIWTWGPETEDYHQQSRSAIYIFRRKD